MEKAVWMTLLGLEVMYVAATFSGELAAFVMWRPTARFERQLHSLPDDKYVGAFQTPVLTYIAGITGGATVSLIGQGGRSTFAGLLFTALIVFSLVQHQFRLATGRHPRPVPRARWRQELAEIQQALGSVPGPSRAELATMRVKLSRLRAVGDRVGVAARSQTWWDAYRQVSRWKRARIAGSTALPLVLGVWAAVAHGVMLRSLIGHGALAALAIGAMAAPALRRMRLRRESLALSREIIEATGHVLARLPRAPRPRPRPLRVRSSARPRHIPRRSA